MDYRLPEMNSTLTPSAVANTDPVVDLMVQGQSKFTAEASSALRKLQDNPTLMLIDRDYLEGKRFSDGKVVCEEREEEVVAAD